MKVIEYIQKNGIEALKEELGIKVKEYSDHGLIVLNYCQIDSPKTDPVVMECRGLILDKNTLEVYCRPFQRFFNAGEAPEVVKDFDIDRAVAYDKIDGSLIKVWHHPIQGWQCGTRGTAFAESSVNGFNLTFCDLVHKALGCSDHKEFQELCGKYLKSHATYLFELTSQENRVVTRYDGTKLWYLGCVETARGHDYTGNSLVEEDVLKIGANKIGQHSFDSVEHCLETASSLPDLKEGYVLHDKVSNKRIKVKSPAYVAVHHIRGEGLNPKRIKELVLTNEQDEYLKYFPEDADLVEPYVAYLKSLLICLDNDYKRYRHIREQKDFALQVKSLPYSGILFTSRAKGQTSTETWSKLDPRQKFKIFSNFLGECSN